MAWKLCGFIYVKLVHIVVLRGKQNKHNLFMDFSWSVFVQRELLHLIIFLALEDGSSEEVETLVFRCSHCEDHGVGGLVGCEGLGGLNFSPSQGIRQTCYLTDRRPVLLTPCEREPPATLPSWLKNPALRSCSRYRHPGWHTNAWWVILTEAQEKMQCLQGDPALREAAAGAPGLLAPSSE